MRWRNLLVAFTVLWLVGCGLLPQLETELSTDENDHMLKMTALCDTLKVKGVFELEFNKTIDYEIKDPEKNPMLTDFEYLEIDGKVISVNDEPWDEVGKFRITSLGEKEATSLRVVSEEEIVSWLCIKRLKSRDKNVAISFSHQEKEQSILLGEEYIVYLENSLEPNHWTLDLEGNLKIAQVIDDDEKSPVFMTEARISFTGSLGAVNPRVYTGLRGRDADLLYLRFRFDDDFKKLSFEEGEGEITLKSEVSSESPDSSMIDFLEVIEDEFEINMKNRYYQNKYREEFNFTDIETIERIQWQDERLEIQLSARYGGEARFPKIRVTTEYFRINNNTGVETLIATTSNLEEADEEESWKTPEKGFRYGETYRVFILVEALVQDRLIVHLEDRNSNDFVEKAGYSKSKLNMSLASPDHSDLHEYFFTVEGKIGNRIDCETIVRSHDSRFCVKTNSLRAKIISAIDEYIYIKERISQEGKKEEFGSESISEGETFAFEVEIGPRSETSADITVEAFIVPSEGFEILDGQLYGSKNLEEGPLTLEAFLSIPITNKEKIRDSEIKVFAYYCINGKPHDILCSTKRMHVDTASWCKRNSPLFVILLSFTFGYSSKFAPIVRFLIEIIGKRRFRSILSFLWSSNELIEVLSDSKEGTDTFKSKQKEISDARINFFLWLFALIGITLVCLYLKQVVGPYWWLLG